MHRNYFKYCVIPWLLLGSLVNAHEAIQLWPNGAPGEKNHGLAEFNEPCWEVQCTRQVTDPTLTVYQPDNANGAAVVVLPGGNYQGLAMEGEGHAVARAFAAQGIFAAVLKYRMPDPRMWETPEAVALQDVRRALVLVRNHAEKWHLQADRIGVVGFSAGSHLATQASVWPDQSRPDFSVLVYGVTEHSETNQQWLQERLLYRPFRAGEADQYDLLAGVDATTPPAFLVHAMDDDICPYRESTLYAEALHAAGGAAELHLFARGGHGFGVGRADDGTDQWIDLAVKFISRLESI